MEARELRVGNLVYEANNLVADISNWHFEKARLDNTPNCIFADPIPLTEEWLLKFGFDDKNIDEPKNNLLEKNGFYIYKDSLRHLITGTPLVYAHQLQNLYFALTGEELTTSE